jgi:hypothetical protein
MHLRAMRHSLNNPDPDLKALKKYEELTAKGTIKKCKIRPELESESESEVILKLQFTLHIQIDPSLIAQRLKESTQSTWSASAHKQKAITQKKQMQVPVSTQALIANPTDVALPAGWYSDQLQHKYLILTPFMANIHNIGQVFTTKQEEGPKAAACNGKYKTSLADPADIVSATGWIGQLKCK